VGGRVAKEEESASSGRGKREGKVLLKHHLSGRVLARQTDISGCTGERWESRVNDYRLGGGGRTIVGALVKTQAYPVIVLL